MLDVINIGGGIPAVYKNTNENFESFIFNKIIEFQRWFGKEIIVEPGRFIAAPAIELKTRVIAIEGCTLYVDASVYNAMPDTIFSNIKLLVKEEKPFGNKYLIKGNSPASEDILRYEVKFEKTPKIGDILTFENAGAYAFHCDFCSLPKVPTIVV